MVFNIGHVRRFRAAEVKHIGSYQDVKNLDAVEGDIVLTFGHLLQWDKDCVPVDLCESWRHMGDTLCDDALREVFPHPSATVGKDLLQCLQDHLASIQVPGDAPSTAAFLREVMQTPPVGLLATADKVVTAQELFLDDSVQIMQALLHYSLAGGLASTRIVRTLEAVSYLVPHVKKCKGGGPPASLEDLVSQIPQASIDRTFVRLAETMQFVLDIMGCSISQPLSEGSVGDDTDSRDSLDRLAYLLPGGKGWKSAVRVRLLHGVARWRVQMRYEKETHKSTPSSVPISQEELAATLGSFSTIPMWCLRRLHIPPRPEQVDAYLALWRHVGFYMGVEPSILQRYFTTPNAADKFVATVALRLFYEDDVDSSSHTQVAPSLLRGPTLPILIAVSNRPPLRTSLAHNIALTTHLLGRPLSAHLGLLPSSLSTRLRMHALLLLQRVPHLVARWYPRQAWVQKRRTVLREGFVRVVRWNMGMRHTDFRPRTDVVAEDGDGGGGGELAPGVAEAEGVRGDASRGKVLSRMWKEVFVEMVCVCIVVCVAGYAILFVGWKYAMPLALAAVTSPDL